jgi:hypothetical protein
VREKEKGKRRLGLGFFGGVRGVNHRSLALLLSVALVAATGGRERGERGEIS